MADSIINLPGEIWKPVVGWEGSYEISNCGRLKRLARPIKTMKWIESQGRAATVERLMTPRRVTRQGHVQITLVRDGRRRTSGVHRLVLEAFIGPCPDGMECCHYDGNASNNRLENLRWDTCKANQADRRRHGTLPMGSASARAKLHETLIPHIRCARLVHGRTFSDIAKQFGVSKKMVMNIVSRRAWRHVA